LVQLKTIDPNPAISLAPRDLIQIHSDMILATGSRNGDARKVRLVFLKNHREVIAAMDLFTVPTATFRVLYFFFVIGHSRRRVRHFNATEHPTSCWIVQQLREAFPDDSATWLPLWIGESERYERSE
jgi:hypothetical protein